MREYLDKVRKPVSIGISKQIVYSLIILIAGILLGLISKVLDEIPGNALPRFLEVLDLRNFFSRMGVWIFCGVCIAVYSKASYLAACNTGLFFVGMVGSYYAYTILVAGFYPRDYMMIWVVMTILSPFMGACVWYAKGTHGISISIAAVIVMVMARQTFAFGLWYFDLRYVLELLLLLLTFAVLFKTRKQIVTVVGVGMVLFFLTSQLHLFWGML